MRFLLGLAVANAKVTDTPREVLLAVLYRLSRSLPHTTEKTSIFEQWVAQQKLN
jgi:hypothetical protein